MCRLPFISSSASPLRTSSTALAAAAWLCGASTIRVLPRSMPLAAAISWIFAAGPTRMGAIRPFCARLDRAGQCRLLAGMRDGRGTGSRLRHLSSSSSYFPVPVVRLIVVPRVRRKSRGEPRGPSPSRNNVRFPVHGARRHRMLTHSSRSKLDARNAVRPILPEPIERKDVGRPRGPVTGIRRGANSARPEVIPEFRRRPATPSRPLRRSGRTRAGRVPARTRSPERVAHLAMRFGQLGMPTPRARSVLCSSAISSAPARSILGTAPRKKTTSRTGSGRARAAARTARSRTYSTLKYSSADSQRTTSTPGMGSFSGWRGDRRSTSVPGTRASSVTRGRAACRSSSTIEIAAPSNTPLTGPDPSTPRSAAIATKNSRG